MSLPLQPNNTAPTQPEQHIQFQDQQPQITTTTNTNNKSQLIEQTQEAIQRLDNEYVTLTSIEQNLKDFLSNLKQEEDVLNKALTHMSKDKSNMSNIELKRLETQKQAQDRLEAALLLELDGDDDDDDDSTEA